MEHNNTLASNGSKPALLQPKKVLTTLTKSWVVAALVGQWIFALYIFIQFGIAALKGDPTSADTSGMIQGYVENDHFGNGMLMSHLLMAIYLSFGGILQLLPYIRAKYPVFHRWNGRIFLTLGLIGAITGMYLTWIRGARLSDIGSIGLTLNGLLIPIAVYLAWKFAINRQFQNHMRWAIHTFILVNGVWTFRLYLMGWFLVNQGANGNTATIDGPADITISFASYLLPMFIAELYFWAKKQRDNIRISIVNCFMLIGLIITVIGIFAATLFMWWPSISAIL